MNDVYTAGIFWKGERTGFHTISTELTVTIQKTGVPEALQSASPSGMYIHSLWICLLVFSCTFAVRSCGLQHYIFNNCSNF